MSGAAQAAPHRDHGGGVVSLDGVTVRHGEVLALEDVSLEIAAGSVDALVGMNGAGKSTLFAAIMGRVPLSSGSVRVFGGPPSVARKAGRVAFMPQGDSVDRAFPLSVREVVTMGRYGRLGAVRRARASDRDAVQDALARVQLSDLAERPIGALSGGQRTRALLARALAQDAELLLLDEPFAGVDQRSEALIAGLLTQLARDGRSVVVSTHDLTTLPDRADRVILLARRLITVDKPEVALAPESLARAFQFPREERP